jgi:hypothetical protein
VMWVSSLSIRHGEVYVYASRARGVEAGHGGIEN